jgi:hypothetical protein
MGSSYIREIDWGLVEVKRQQEADRLRKSDGPTVNYSKPQQQAAPPQPPPVVGNPVVPTTGANSMRSNIGMQRGPNSSTPPSAPPQPAQGDGATTNLRSPLAPPQPPPRQSAAAPPQPPRQSAAAPPQPPPRQSAAAPPQPPPLWKPHPVGRSSKERWSNFQPPPPSVAPPVTSEPFVPKGVRERGPGRQVQPQGAGNGPFEPVRRPVRGRVTPGYESPENVAERGVAGSSIDTPAAHAETGFMPNQTALLGSNGRVVSNNRVPSPPAPKVNLAGVTPAYPGDPKMVQAQMNAEAKPDNSWFMNKEPISYAQFYGGGAKEAKEVSNSGTGEFNFSNFVERMKNSPAENNKPNYSNFVERMKNDGDKYEAARKQAVSMPSAPAPKSDASGVSPVNPGVPSASNKFNFSDFVARMKNSPAENNKMDYSSFVDRMKNDGDKYEAAHKQVANMPSAPAPNKPPAVGPTNPSKNPYLGPPSVGPTNPPKNPHLGPPSVGPTNPPENPHLGPPSVGSTNPPENQRADYASVARQWGNAMGSAGSTGNSDPNNVLFQEYRGTPKEYDDYNKDFSSIFNDLDQNGVLSKDNQEKVLNHLDAKFEQIKNRAKKKAPVNLSNAASLSGNVKKSVSDDVLSGNPYHYGFHIKSKK